MEGRPGRGGREGENSCTRRGKAARRSAYTREALVYTQTGKALGRINGHGFFYILPSEAVSLSPVGGCRGGMWFRCWEKPSGRRNSQRDAW